jgi:hypothetical protein
MTSIVRIIQCLTFIFPYSLNAQLISDQVNYGTLGIESPVVLKLSDGNFLVGTSNPSGITGTKTCMNNGNSDIWIFKMDVNNNILWQLCYGGTEEENLSNFAETDDGHVLICGRSNSSISGNKTVGTNGGYDFWVIKMDLDGNEVWQRNFGTTQDDASPYIVSINANNYLLSNASSYGIDGDKSEESYGSSDYWILSIDDEGNILWDKTIGGPGQEIFHSVVFDSFSDLLYVIGHTNSGIGGLKDEDTYGSDDIWLVSLDLSGNLLNQKTLGGLGFDMPGYFILTDNGEILLSNISSSPVSGNKTSENFGDYDIWLVHLNQDLTILNDFSYGGDKIDGTLFSKMGVENELIIGGFSRSSISGNKTEDSRGFGDAWILSVNYLEGEINWQKTIGGSLYEYITYLYDEGEYYKVFCASESPVSGDKTVGTFGDYDIWIFDLSKTVGLEENDVLKRQVYPNPSTGFFHVSLADGEIARIYDLQGKEIAFKFENGMLDLSTLYDGIYLLNIEKTDAEREIIRLVKTQ